VSDAVQKINWDEMEEVLVRIRPWIRVDGTLNRRVLDRYLISLIFLGSIYIFLLRYRSYVSISFPELIINLLGDISRLCYLSRFSGLFKISFYLSCFE
jgi:hypothetical protein